MNMHATAPADAYSPMSDGAIEIAVLHAGDVSSLIIAAKISCAADWEKFCASINPMAGVLWPETIEADAPAPARRPYVSKIEGAGLPPEGTLDRRAHDLARDKGLDLNARADRLQLADLMDLTVQQVGIVAARLRKRGVIVGNVIVEPVA